MAAVNPCLLKRVLKDCNEDDQRNRDHSRDRRRTCALGPECLFGCEQPDAHAKNCGTHPRKLPDSFWYLERSEGSYRYGDRSAWISAHGERLVPAAVHGGESPDCARFCRPPPRFGPQNGAGAFCGVTGGISG